MAEPDDSREKPPSARDPVNTLSNLLSNMRSMIDNAKSIAEELHDEQLVSIADVEDVLRGRWFTDAWETDLLPRLQAKARKLNAR